MLSRRSDNVRRPKPVDVPRGQKRKRRPDSSNGGFGGLINFDRPSYKYASQISERRIDVDDSGGNYGADDYQSDDVYYDDEARTASSDYNDDYATTTLDPPPELEVEEKEKPDLGVGFDDWLSKFGVETTTASEEEGEGSPRRRRLVSGEPRPNGVGGGADAKREWLKGVVAAMKRAKSKDVQEDNKVDENVKGRLARSGFEMVADFASALLFGK